MDPPKRIKLSMDPYKRREKQKSLARQKINEGFGIDNPESKEPGQKYFDLFLNHLIVIFEDIHEPSQTVAIPPKCIALVYLETELEEMTKILCMFVFTEEDLNSRNTGGLLPVNKTLAISNFISWIQEKNGIDLYSYRPNQPVKQLSPGDLEKIQQVFNTFNTVHEVSSQVSDINCPFNRVFNMMLEYDADTVGTSAQVAGILTQESTEKPQVFVDGLTFDKLKLSLACEKVCNGEESDLRLLKVLSSQIWADDYKVNNIDDICIVKRVALMRMFGYVKRYRNAHFDSLVEDHNIFPLEISTIQKFLEMQYILQDTLFTIVSTSGDILCTVTEEQLLSLNSTNPDEMVHLNGEDSTVENIDPLLINANSETDYSQPGCSRNFQNNTTQNSDVQEGQNSVENELNDGQQPGIGVSNKYVISKDILQEATEKFEKSTDKTVCVKFAKFLRNILFDDKERGQFVWARNGTLTAPRDTKFYSTDNRTDAIFEAVKTFHQKLLKQDKIPFLKTYEEIRVSIKSDVFRRFSNCKKKNSTKL